MNVEHEPDEDKPGMNINLDRSRRVRSTMMYWVLLLAVGAVLAYLMLQFTGSKLIAFGLAGGMLLYMLIASAVTSKHLTQSGDGRMD